MRSGRTPEEAGIRPGEHFLPVYSVETDAEAALLLAGACVRNYAGELIAPGLAERQTLERLYGFGHRLDRIYKIMQRRARGAGLP